jgi:hypothetical protein
LGAKNMVEKHLVDAEQILHDLKTNIELALDTSQNKDILLIMKELVDNAKISKSISEYYKNKKE